MIVLVAELCVTPFNVTFHSTPPPSVIPVSVNVTENVALGVVAVAAELGIDWPPFVHAVTVKQYSAPPTSPPTK
ncbi:MAG: hypothetical protein ACREEL_14915 [Stellaceae bacterium]